MRKISILAATILAACGSSSSSPPTYALMDAAATEASGSCTITAVGPIGASVALVGASDYTGACTSMTPPLTIPGGGALAQFIIVRVDISSTTPPPLNTGTYKFYNLASGALPPADPANPLNGFKFFTGVVGKCAAADGGGGGTAPESVITGGNVVIDTVSPLHGTLSATIEGGTSIGGTFTAPTCAGATALDISALCVGVNSGGLTFPTFTCQ